MLVSVLTAALALQGQRIERPIRSNEVPVSVATRGLVEETPKLEYDLRELLMCDPDLERRRARLCYAIANLGEWREEERQRTEDRLMEEAVDQAREPAEEKNTIPWR